MAEEVQSPVTILRRKQVQIRIGLSRSTLYLRIAEGTFIKPVSLGARAVGWPAHEVAALNAARIAGKPDAEIRELVTKLEAARKASAERSDGKLHAQAPPQLPACENPSQLLGGRGCPAVRDAQEYRACLGEGGTAHLRRQAPDADSWPRAGRVSKGAADKKQAALPAGRNLLRAMPCSETFRRRPGGIPADYREPGEP